MKACICLAGALLSHICLADDPVGGCEEEGAGTMSTDTVYSCVQQ